MPVINEEFAQLSLFCFLTPSCGKANKIKQLQFSKCLTCRRHPLVIAIWLKMFSYVAYLSCGGTPCHCRKVSTYIKEVYLNGKDRS